MLRLGKRTTNQTFISKGCQVIGDEGFAGISSEYSDSLLRTRAGTNPSKCLGTNVHFYNPTRSPLKSYLYNTLKKTSTSINFQAETIAAGL